MQTTKLVVALSFAVLSMPAVAGPQPEIRVMGVKHVGEGYQVEVPYRDLDLRQPEQVRVLEARVGAAAAAVCAPRLYFPQFQSSEKAACVDGALAGAAPQMALARKRAQEFAKNGWSAIPEVGIALRAAF